MAKKKMTPTEELAAVRAQRSQHIAEAADIAGRALPLEEYQIEAAIHAKATCWRPDVRALLHPTGRGPSHFSLLPIVFMGDMRDGTVQPDIREAYTIAQCALSPETVRAKLVEEVERYIAEHGPEISSEERGRLLGELDRKIRDLEVEEERIIRAAERDGIRLARRGDASPAVVLGDLGEQKNAA